MASLQHILLAVLCAAVLNVSQCARNQESPRDRLISILNGVYLNGEPRAEGETYEDINLGTYKPVSVPALEPAKTIYFGLTKDGILLRHELLAITENDDGSLAIQPYQLNQIGENFDTSLLAGMELSEFSFNPDCAITLRQTRRNVFKGMWADCHSRPGSPLVYPAIVRRNNIVFILPTQPRKTRLRYNRIKSFGRFTLSDSTNCE